MESRRVFFVAQVAVSTQLKNMSQIGSFPEVGVKMVKIKNL